MPSSPSRLKCQPEICAQIGAEVGDLIAPIYACIPPKSTAKSETASPPLSPLVVNSPHSGRYYLNRFLSQACLPLEVLRQVEDTGLDRLLAFEPLPAPVLCANFPRSFVDVNRNEDEIDPDMFASDILEGLPESLAQKKSRYLRSGLGMIPRVAAHQRRIYDQPLPLDEIAFRKTQFYRPYHAKLKAMLEAAQSPVPKSHAPQSHAHETLLLDCHSMPSLGPSPGPSLSPSLMPSSGPSPRPSFGASNADIVIGNHHGQSAASWLTQVALDYFADAGLKVAVNVPFSGGFITQHYGEGHAETRRHALQIEICRSHYLDEHRLELKPDWERMASILCRFILYMDERLRRHNQG